MSADNCDLLGPFFCHYDFKEPDPKEGDCRICSKETMRPEFVHPFDRQLIKANGHVVFFCGKCLLAITVANPPEIYVEAEKYKADKQTYTQAILDIIEKEIDTPRNHLIGPYYDFWSGYQSGYCNICGKDTIWAPRSQFDRRQLLADGTGMFFCSACLIGIAATNPDNIYAEAERFKALPTSHYNSQ